MSEDIDLFSEEEVDTSAIEPFLEMISIKLKIKKIIKQNYLGLYTYKLEFEDGEILKKVKDLKTEDFPKMLVSFRRQDMERFFIKLAKSLEKEIFKN